MTRKKAVALVVIAASLGALVVGCGSSGDTNIAANGPTSAGGTSGGNCAGSSCAGTGGAGPAGGTGAVGGTTAGSGSGGTVGGSAGAATGGAGSGAVGAGGGGGGAAGAWTATPEIIADSEADPQGIAVDADTIYWTTAGVAFGGGAVRKRAKAGGPVTTIANSQTSPSSIAVDRSTIYWLSVGSGTDGAVMSLSKMGGSPTALLTNLKQPWTMVLDDTYVYVSEGECGPISRVPKLGGAAEPITTSVCDARSLMVTPTKVYWVGDGVQVSTLPSGSPMALVPATAMGERGTLNGTDIFWTQVIGTTGSVNRLSITDGSETTIVPGEPQPTAVGADANWVYWVTAGAPTAFRAAPRAGGAPITVMPLASNSLDFVVDVDAIYLAEEGPPGRIWRIHQ